MKVRTVAVALTVVAAAVVAVAAAVDGPRRQPLELPAVSAFPAGPCRELADPVLSLGRFTYEHIGSDRLPADAYPYLRQRAEQLAAVRAKEAAPDQAAPDQAGPDQAAPAQAAPAEAGPDQAAPAQAPPAQSATTQAATDRPGDEEPRGASPGGAVTGGGTGTVAPGPNPVQQALSPRIDAVLTAIGFLRLRPGEAYDPALLRDLEATRAELQRACVSRRD